MFQCCNGSPRTNSAAASLYPSVPNNDCCFTMHSHFLPNSLLHEATFPILPIHHRIRVGCSYSHCCKWFCGVQLQALKSTLPARWLCIPCQRMCCTLSILVTSMKLAF